MARRIPQRAIDSVVNAVNATNYALNDAANATNEALNQAANAVNEAANAVNNVMWNNVNSQPMGWMDRVKAALAGAMAYAAANKLVTIGILLALVALAWWLMSRKPKASKPKASKEKEEAEPMVTTPMVTTAAPTPMVTTPMVTTPTPMVTTTTPMVTTTTPMVTTAAPAAAAPTASEAPLATSAAPVTPIPISKTFTTAAPTQGSTGPFTAPVTSTPAPTPAPTPVTTALAPAEPAWHVTVHRRRLKPQYCALQMPALDTNLRPYTSPPRLIPIGPPTIRRRYPPPALPSM